MEDEQIRELDSVLDKKLNNVPMSFKQLTMDLVTGYVLHKNLLKKNQKNMF